MSTPHKDLMTRLMELVKEHGHQWKQIAPILAAEGYRDAQGNPYSDNYLRQRMKRRETAGHEKRSEPSEAGKSSESSEPETPELARTIAAVLAQNGLLESTVKEVLVGLERTATGQAHDMPPQPERVTDRRWEKLSGTCDCELVRLFHCRRRDLRLSVSQMLDYVLWNFFGKPRLSFQPEDSKPSEDGGGAT